MLNYYLSCAVKIWLNDSVLTVGVLSISFSPKTHKMLEVDDVKVL